MNTEKMSGAGQGKVRLFSENGEVCLLDRREAERFGLAEGDRPDEAQWKEICGEVLAKRAKNRALYLLGRTDRTEHQLRELLRRGGYPAEVIDAAVSYVKSYHYLDDTRYAENYVRSAQKKKSLAQMRAQLLERGVSKERIEAALEKELTVEPEELIASLLEKRHYDAENADERERRNTYQYLSRRGFRNSEILRAMRA